ncbi:MAG: UxaA family hydrolase [Planctomycetes bacterium]|nr:UxaA family hydrolase [Planctomycetota bacterium]
MEKVKFITIDPKDNVATALANAEKDQIAQITDELKIKLLEPIAAGHKIAIKPIEKGQPIIKYGYNIGKATKDILTGQHVHVQNVESNRGRGDL